MLDFLKFRPAADTCDAIAEALERARAAPVEAQQRAERARAVRDSLLLDSDAAALAAAEKVLVIAREDIDRAGAIVAQLEARYVAAKRAERLSKADDASKAAAAAEADLRKWWEKNEAGLRRILTEGHRHAVAFAAADQMRGHHERIAQSEYPDAEFTDRRHPMSDHREWPKLIGDLIQHGVVAPKPPSVPEAPALEEESRRNAGVGVLMRGFDAPAGAGALAFTTIRRSGSVDAAPAQESAA
jgi:hypothetical protein